MSSFLLAASTVLYSLISSFIQLVFTSTTTTEAAATDRVYSCEQEQERLTHPNH